jgi:hypothetical protein
MVGLQPEVRTGVGHLVATEPAAQVERADLLMVPARAARRPAEVLDCVVGVDRRAQRIVNGKCCH